MHKDDQSDKITQTRSSFDNQRSIFKNLSLFFCPCLNLEDQSNNKAYNQQPSSVPSVKKSMDRQLFSPFMADDPDKFAQRIKKKNYAYMSGYHDNQQTVYQDTEIKMPNRSLNNRKLEQFKQSQNLANFLKRKKTESILGPINFLQEDQLFPSGIEGNRLLVKISTVKLQPSSFVVKKYLLKDEESQQFSIQYEFEKYWNQRYHLFQKFDQGIKIDEKSWHFLIPETISQYIARRCEGAETILDAFSGVGGTSIKLATVCCKLIANDKCSTKLNNLFHNANIYQVDNIKMTYGNFLLSQESANVVFIHPPRVKLLQDQQTLNLWSFEPSLEKIIEKTFQISKNLVMLLPIKVQIKSICATIYQKSLLNNKLASTCSIKIQKIYYEGKFKFICLFYGPLVQTEIKLNQELAFIYKKLQTKEQKNFKHKKLLKFFREHYGISKVLNLIFDCHQFKKQNQTQIQTFIQYVQDKNLISKNKLQKILHHEQEGSMDHNQLESYDPSYFGGTSMQLEQQKYEQISQSPETQTERTQSYYSNFTISTEKQQKKLFRSSSSIQAISRSSNNQYELDQSGIVTKAIDQHGSPKIDEKSQELQNNV